MQQALALRSIDIAPFKARFAGAAAQVGERPELQWLKIARLRIDPRYQRDVSRKGESNILSIAQNFAWAKFTPVIVASVGEGLYAIVDGQHRSTAAALRGFESVPCVIIAADAAAQADAFVAINGSVTAMTPLQLHAARLAAGSADASELATVCAAAGVTISRYPIPANKIKVGETLAVSMLHGQLKKYGRDVLIAALSCITKTRKGNPGMIRGQVVEALCAVLEAEPEWRSDLMRLIFAMQTFDFVDAFSTARTAAIEQGVKIADHLVGSIGAHLDGAVPADDAAKPPQPAAAPPAPARKPQQNTLDAVTYNGVDIARSEDRGRVTYAGRSIDVSPRGALLVEVLARAKPNCVGNSFLIQRLWNGHPPPGAETALDMVCRDLSGLKSLGLEVRKQRGVGLQLVECSA